MKETAIEKYARRRRNPVKIHADGSRSYPCDIIYDDGRAPILSKYIRARSPIERDAQLCRIYGVGSGHVSAEIWNMGEVRE